MNETARHLSYVSALRDLMRRFTAFTAKYATGEIVKNILNILAPETKKGACIGESSFNQETMTLALGKLKRFRSLSI